ncbi:MAG: MBOAT family O-acyltransferase [Terriglobales bacterium]
MELTFTSLEFIFFLGVCLGLLHASGKGSVRTWLLIIFSYLFYLTFGVAGVLVVTFTAVVDFIVGRRLGNTTSEATRKRWLWAGLAANLGPLVFFKYSGFFVGIIAAFLHPLGVRVSLPASPVFSIIGLSYFTFAGMSYVLDVYWETMEPARSFSEFACYLLYFPKLIAGPIVRAADLLPQFSQGFKITTQDFEIGCGYLLVGAVKKLVIADQLASHVSMILAAPQHYDAFTLVQGMVGYTVQIYADFSGYTDMAIGCARLMGLRFPQNFLMPYSSVNIVEFWRRWHVTMSTWFRDYVFLPLEFRSRGTRNANVRASRNIVITMLLCGLWHGASWNFVVWGGLHGVALAVYQVYTSLLPRKVQRQTRSAFHPGTLVSRALTLSVVMVGWIFFGTRTLAVAFKYLWRMVTWSGDGVALGSPYILPLAALMLLAHLLINKDRNLIEEVSTYSAPARVLTYASLLLALACLVPSDTVPFAYVRF